MRRFITILVMSSLALGTFGCGSDDEAEPGENAEENANQDPEQGPQLDLQGALSLSGEVGEEISDTVSVENTGDEELTVAFEVQDDWLTLEPMDLSLDAESGEDVTVVATCPDEEGALETEVAIATNDESADGTTLTVNLNCTDDSEVEPDVGELVVTVEGLSDSSEADITVTGPDGFSESIAGSTTLEELTPGDYDVVAAEVEDGEAVFAPVDAEQSVDVVAGESASVTVTYEEQEEEVLLGAVDIQLEGLPTDATPLIELEGPESYQINGEGLIEDVEPGDYTVMPADHEEAGAQYLADDQAITVEAEETVAVEIEYEMVFAELTVEIEGLPGGVDADVEVAGGEFSETITETTSFDELVPTGYTVTTHDVDHDGTSYQGDSFNIVLNSGDDETITVEYVEVPGTLDVTVSGLDIEGLAEADANISVEGDGFQADITAAGTTTLSDLSPGEYDIVVGDAQQGPATFVGDDDTVTVDSDATAEINIEYEVVLGNLHVDATGVPSGAEMEADIEGPDFSESIQGATQFDDILPGEYTVEFSHFASGGTIYDPDPSEADFTVESGATTDAVADYGIRPGTLDVNVNIPDSLQVEFHIEEGGSSVHSFTSDGAGLESVDLEPGTYTVTTGGTVEDEWGNEFEFSGTNESISLESGDTETQNISTQYPTLVTTEVDDGDEYGSLRAVIDRVNEGSEVTFADDVNEIALQGSILINKSLSLIGHGDVVVTQASGSNARLFTISFVGDEDEDEEVLVQDINFEGAVSGSGGAFTFSANNVDATFFGVEFHDNEATSFGGGAVNIMPSNNATVRFQDSHFEGNVAEGDEPSGAGGAVRARSNDNTTNFKVEFENVSFDGNQAPGFRGGALSLEGSVRAELRDVEFEDNHAETDGGAIFVDASSRIELADVTLEGNSAGDAGGAIFSNGEFDGERIVASDNSAHVGGALQIGANGSLVDSHIHDNTATNRGGGLHVNSDGDESGSFDILRTLIEGNEVEGSSGWGGGVFADERGLLSLLEVQNTTIANNTAPGHGGGIYLGADGFARISYSTMIGNVANINGGAITAQDSQFRVIVLEANYIADNSGNNEVFSLEEEALTSGGYNFISSMSSTYALDEDETDIINGTPSYSSLADNGGPTQTIAIDPGSDGFRDIPVEDCRRPGFAFLLLQDQRGMPRPSGGECTRGAWEADAHYEKFESADLSDDFDSGSFEGVDGRTWEYSEVRNEGDEGLSSRPGARFESEGAYLRTSGVQGVDGPVESLSILYAPAGDADDDRQIRVFVDGNVVKVGEVFDNPDENWRVLVVDDFDGANDFELEIENNAPAGVGDVVIDQITWR